jgi:UDP-N-acetylglucosamine/UDP-N-acetylgalactosamine diphosphorylase
MLAVPDDLRRRLAAHGQEHVLAGWERLSDTERRAFLAQLEALDLAGLARLYAERDRSFKPPDVSQIEPVPVVPLGAPDDAAARRLGEEALARGEVAALLVAGGQGSRLGFDRPKGLYPVGPVSRKPLFQVHAEKVLAPRQRHRCPLPLLVMTSPATHEETLTYFEQIDYHGLGREGVRFFQQGTMPSLDLNTGKILLEAPGRLFLSPDGHGGTLTALKTSGLLRWLREHGFRHVFYFQVDNPLVQIADPVFLGHHLRHRAEVSSRVIAKSGPEERVGVFAQVGGRCTIIEYSDLKPEQARETDATGRLRLWAGSPAIHVFDVGFLERAIDHPQGLPFHVARKKVPHQGDPNPARENALKFERFIFDVLPLAERWLVTEGSRADEFAPLKNAEGADSPATVHRAITEQAARWLDAAGVAVPRHPNDSCAHALEVSPLFALDADEFADKVDRSTRITGPTYFG